VRDTPPADAAAAEHVQPRPSSAATRAPGAISGAAEPPGRLAILGLGQLGGSIALGARAAGLVTEIVGFGRSEESLARARALGLADRTTTDAREAVRGAATVVISTPLRSVSTVAARIRGALAPGALVIDVGSVKATAARDIEAHVLAAEGDGGGGREGRQEDQEEQEEQDEKSGTSVTSGPSSRAREPAVSFVACHPLAGTERFGPDAARADLYRGRRCIVCPSPRTSPAAIERARRLWSALGAEVILMPAALHDATMAAVSHLPHVAAFALARALGDLPPDVAASALALPTTSLRDTTRIAASSPEMWRDILLENRAALLPLVSRFEDALATLRAALAAGDAASVEGFLGAARATRTHLFPE
jgi:cyclohexadieny/prephenate dehydrogenase